MAKKVTDEQKFRPRVKQFVLESELTDVRLLSGVFYQNIRGDELPDQLHSTIEAEGSIEKSTSSLYINAGLVLTGRYKGDSEDAEPGLEIRAQYGAHYKIPTAENVPDKFIKYFASTIAMIHIWPFWREFVQSTTGRMALPTLTIPLYKYENAGRALAAGSNSISLDLSDEPRPPKKPQAGKIKRASSSKKSTRRKKG